jgi:DNA-binding transcriptional regulator YdaS (Cro superfamily)
LNERLAALRFIQRHPAWIVGGGVLLAALRPGLAWKWLRRGWVTWQIMHKLRGS